EEVRDRRLALVSEATAAEEAVQAAEEALDKLVASQRERDADFLAAKKALEVKQTELDRARADAKSASAALAQARARREVRARRKRATNSREQERRAVEAQATIESITVSAEDVEGLSDLVTEVRIAENARTAAAAQIVARRLGDTEVSVDGAALPDDTAEEFAVVKDMRVTSTRSSTSPSAPASPRPNSTEPANRRRPASMPNWSASAADPATRHGTEPKSAPVPRRCWRRRTRPCACSSAAMIGPDSIPHCHEPSTWRENLRNRVSRGTNRPGSTSSKPLSNRPPQPSMPHRRPSTPRERLSSALGPTGTRLGWQPFGRRRPTN